MTCNYAKWNVGGLAIFQDEQHLQIHCQDPASHGLRILPWFAHSHVCTHTARNIKVSKHIITFQRELEKEQMILWDTSTSNCTRTGLLIFSDFLWRLIIVRLFLFPLKHFYRKCLWFGPHHDRKIKQMCMKVRRTAQHVQTTRVRWHNVWPETSQRPWS